MMVAPLDDEEVFVAVDAAVVLLECVDVEIEAEFLSGDEKRLVLLFQHLFSNYIIISLSQEQCLL